MRRTLAAALLAVAGLAAVMIWGRDAGFRLPMPWPWPAGPGDGGAGGEDAGPVQPGAGEQVATGVRLWDRDLSGWSAAELRTWLEAQAAAVARDPVPATLDPVSRGVIPELAGARLDVDATAAAVLSAPPGARVEPRFTWLEPGTTLADFPLAPIYQGNPQRPQVTLMINVAWGNAELAQMLDILDAEGVRTTFFLVGRWVERYPELARAVADRGHEIANHGYSDAVSIGALDYAAARADLERGHEVITRVTGREPRWFSPHRGELSEALLEACRDLGYRLFLWTVDTIDWQDPDRGTLLARVLDRAGPGSLVLMHPRAVTVDALPDLVRGLRHRGLEPVPLGTLLDPHHPPDPTTPDLPTGPTVRRPAGPGA
ncbi:MAG TPA: polysaccharide deacetylase family protein [Bacillota bacterium]